MDTDRVKAKNRHKLVYIYIKWKTRSRAATATTTAEVNESKRIYYFINFSFLVIVHISILPIATDQKREGKQSFFCVFVYGYFLFVRSYVRLLLLFIFICCFFLFYFPLAKVYFLPSYIFSLFSPYSVEIVPFVTKVSINYYHKPHAFDFAVAVVARNFFFAAAVLYICVWLCGNKFSVALGWVFIL